MWAHSKPVVLRKALTMAAAVCGLTAFWLELLYFLFFLSFIILISRSVAYTWTIWPHGPGSWVLSQVCLSSVGRPCSDRTHWWRLQHEWCTASWLSHQRTGTRERETEYDQERRGGCLPWVINICWFPSLAPYPRICTNILLDTETMWRSKESSKLVFRGMWSIFWSDVTI